jgi:hypothetical protein
MGVQKVYAESDLPHYQCTARLFNRLSSPCFFTTSVPVGMPGAYIKQNRFVTPFSPQELHRRMEVHEMIGLDMKEDPCKRNDSPQLPGTGFVPPFDPLFCLILQAASIYLAHFGRNCSSIDPQKQLFIQEASTCFTQAGRNYSSKSIPRFSSRSTGFLRDLRVLRALRGSHPLTSRSPLNGAFVPRKISTE